MKKKVSDKQKIVRVFIAGTVALLYYNDTINGYLAYGLMIISIIMLGSALLNWK